MTEDWTDRWTVRKAREYILRHRDEGVRCPVCNRPVKVYHRPLNSGMARVLIAQWLTAGQDWANTTNLPRVKKLGTSGREGAKLVHWGLMEHDGRRREDGGKPNHWRISELGRRFVLGYASVPSHVWIITPNTLLKQDDSQYVHIKDALGEHFDYDELLGEP